MVTGFATSALAQTLLGPLSKLAAATRRMVELGDMSALGRVIPPRNDEVGALVRNYNEMLDMLATLSDAAQRVAGGDLRVEIDHPGELHAAFSIMVEQLHGIVTQLRELAVEVASGSSEIYAATQEHERAAAQQAQVVRDARDTAASLARAAEGINAAAHGVAENAARSLSTSDLSLARITELEAHARGIRELLEVIREVADRSDLLALNGALEATRAGEAGRGFTLVASEMRRLAERVTGTVAGVSERVADIERSSASTLESTQDGRTLAHETVEAARRIEAATLAQRDDTAQASAAAAAMAQLVDSSAVATTQTLAVAKAPHERVAALVHLTRQFELGERRP